MRRLTKYDNGNPRSCPFNDIPPKLYLRRRDKGLTIVFVLIFLLLIVSFAATYFLMATSGLKAANRTADTKRAYYAADAGLADAFIQLRSYPNPPASFTVSNNSYAIGTQTESYSATAVTDGASWPTYTITSTGTYGNISKILQLVVRETSASRFAYLSNSKWKFFSANSLYIFILGKY